MVVRRVLVNGGAGFVGAHLFAHLESAAPDVELHKSSADVTDAAAVRAEIDSVAPDVLVHLAAVADIIAARDTPKLAWQVNLHGALNVAEAVRRQRPDCLLIYASSADAYGASFAAGTPVDETAALAPKNVYGATKAAADLALGAMAGEGLRVLRLRLFNHIGPGQAPGFVVSAFAEQIVRIRLGLQPPVMHVGALDSCRDFLDVRDVCAAYAACIVRADAVAPGLILNIASGQPRRIGDVLDALLETAGVEAELRTDPTRLRKNEIPIAVGDATRARRVLDWVPRVAWDATLRDILADWTARIRASEG